MRTQSVPTMPVPRILESLAGVSVHPDDYPPEIAVRVVIVSIANAVGGQLADHVEATITANPDREGLHALRAMMNAAVEALDDLVDAFDAAFPVPNSGEL